MFRLFHTKDLGLSSHFLSRSRVLNNAIISSVVLLQALDEQDRVSINLGVIPIAELTEGLDMGQILYSSSSSKQTQCRVINDFLRVKQGIDERPTEERLYSTIGHYGKSFTT